MASVKFVKARWGSGGQKGRVGRRVTSMEIIFELSPEEALLLPSPRGVAKAFGPARRYESVVRGKRGGELVIVYAIADLPFGTTDPKEIRDRAIAHVDRVLTTLAKEAPAKA